MHCEVEKDIGWDFNSLTEDVLFTVYAGGRGYRTAWHGGELHSTSPASLVDFIRQRRRWMRGILQVVLNKKLKVKYRAFELYLFLCSLLGMILIVCIIIDLFYDITPFAHLWYYLFPALLMFPAIYFTGCKGNLKDRLTAGLLSWVFVILEGVAGWLSLVNPPQGFDIVKKT